MVFSSASRYGKKYNNCIFEDVCGPTFLCQNLQDYRPFCNTWREKKVLAAPGGVKNFR